MKSIRLAVTVVILLAYVAGATALTVTTQASATRMAILQGLGK